VASFVLFATAVLKLASLAALRAFFQSPDPVLEIPTGIVLALAAVAELTVATVQVSRRFSDHTAGVALLWFTACSAVYRFIYGFTSSEPCPCLGYLPKLLFSGALRLRTL
jgi:hypothetical protein